MKFLVLISSNLLFSILTSPAQADESTQGSYFGLGGSATFLQDSNIKVSGSDSIDRYSYKTGYGADTSVGYDFGGVRAEAEYAYRTNTADKSGFAAGSLRTDSHAVMANAYADVPTRTLVKPYIGAGVGYALVRAEGDRTDGKIAYQGMAGLNFEVSKSTTLYAGYKYFATTNSARFDDSAAGKYSLDYHSHNAEMGLRFKF